MAIILLVFVLFGIVQPQPLSAQENAINRKESCFVYYDYGQVKVYLSSDKSSYNPGDKAQIAGTINNLNSFPLRDVTLYAQVKRVNDSVDFIKNGHSLIDKKTFLENLNLLAGESLNASFELLIDVTYPPGDYQIQYFVFSKHGFNYAGRNFLEEDVAGVTNFTIDGNRENTVYFDPSTLTVNGASHDVRESINKFPLGRINLSAALSGVAGADQISAKYYIFSYDDGLEENLIEDGESELNAQNKYVLKAQFNPEKSGAYIFLAETEFPYKSKIKYRFAVSGSDPGALKIADLGVSAFPPKVSDKAYFCFHSATDGRSANYTVRLSLLDQDNNVVDSKELIGPFDSSVAAISLPLEKVYNQGSFKIRGETISEKIPENDKTVELEYSCDIFASSVTDFNISYNPAKSDALKIEGVDGCGRVSQSASSVLDQIKISKDGKLVKEDYNSSAYAGEYKLGNLPSGDYSVEVKKGDMVKVMSINVPPKKQDYLIRILILVVLVVAGLIGFLIIRRRQIKLRKKIDKNEA